MINLLGLCRTIRDQFPIPASSTKIKDAVLTYLGEEPTLQTQIDLVKVLVAQWKRKGWTWDVNGAVLLESDEDVLFHEEGLTFIKTPEDFVENQVLLFPVKEKEYHPRVVWFK